MIPSSHSDKMGSTRLIFILHCVILLTGAVVQQIEIYSEPYQEGSYVVLREKIPDLRDLKPFLRNAKSYCVTGLWDFYSSTDYNGLAEVFLGTDYTETRKCENYYNFGDFNSARFLGPADTRTKSISIYVGTETDIFEGNEVVVTCDEVVDLQMNQTTSASTFSRTNWTIYSENNFQGTSLCLAHNGLPNPKLTFQLDFTVRSVRRNCE